MNAKSCLRNQYRTQLGRIPSALYERWSVRIVEELRALLMSCTRPIGIFLPLRREPNIRPLITDFLRRGRQLLLPTRTGNGWAWVSMEAADMDASPKTFMVDRPHKIPSIALVPGLAFSAAGIRLGHGGGVYDQFLLTDSSTLRIGVHFPYQRTTTLPEDPWDIPMQGLVSPTGTHWISRYAVASRRIHR